jgi:hypothetical protein
MKRKIIFVVCALGFIVAVLVTSAVASIAAGGSTFQVPANNSAISYEGRYDSAASGAVRLGFPGVSLHIKFRGSILTMRADASDDDLYFDVSVDGAAPTLLKLHKGAGDYAIVQSDRLAEHTVVLTRRNESWQGTVEIADFALNAGGELLPAPELPKHKLMFIGDSVTCGELTAYEPGRDTKAKINSNGRLSYGMILARQLEAQCHLVSYGGRGIIRDWQGIRDTRNAPQFYELALPDDPSVAWDHSRYVPDAIGIQLGTNDFSQGIPDQNEFVNAYVQLIEKIRRDAPNAVIVVMDSPMVGDDQSRGPRRSALHFYLGQIVDRVANKKVVLASLKHYPGVPGNTHPTGREHEAIAAELEPIFRGALGW